MEFKKKTRELADAGPTSRKDIEWQMSWALVCNKSKTFKNKYKEGGRKRSTTRPWSPQKFQERGNPFRTPMGPSAIIQKDGMRKTEYDWP